MSATRYYRSKIGRLPFAIRNELNERIRDGATGLDVLDWLNATKEMRKVCREQKCGPVTAQNLTDWRSSGYADWLEDQHEADRKRRIAETASTMAAAAGGNLAAVGCKIATGKILDIIEEVDPEQMADLAAALVKLRASENADRKTALAAEKNDIQKEQLSLSRAKFERDTCRMFIKWAANADALALATDKSVGNDEKTERLGRMMFGELWEGAGDGK